MSEENSNEIVDQRRAKLTDLRAQGHNPVSYTHLTLPTTPYV